MLTSAGFYLKRYKQKKIVFFIDFDFLNMIMSIKYSRQMGNTLKIKRELDVLT